jgi:FHA domain/Bacterial regulatory proteins, luxR family
MGFPRHTLSPAELAGLVDAERDGGTFLAYRDGAGDLRFEPLEEVDRLSLGRSAENDVELGWDPEVSRAHAQLERVGGDWTVVDDGLSRNGSFVNDERVVGRRRLEDGDMLRLGHTRLLFRAPLPVTDSTVAADPAAIARVTPAERRVLVALCRPFAAPGAGALPAGNTEIADELSISVAGVKSHLQSLFAKLGIDDLPQYRKRTELAQRALASGLVAPRDLGR